MGKSNVVVKNAQDITQPWIRWFMYGETGAGKTTAASTFPDPIFLVPSTENSIITLMGTDIPYVEISDREDMLNAINYLTAGHDAMQRLYAKGDEAKATEAFPYQTIVVESLSHYCELLVEDIGRSGQRKMDQQAWGLLSSHLRTLHAMLTRLDTHLVYTSLARLDDNGQGQPLMVGKNAIMMPAACDVISYQECVPTAKNQTPVYRTHFKKYGPYPARTRFRALPDHLDNFTFSMVENVLGIA